MDLRGTHFQLIMYNLTANKVFSIMSVLNSMPAAWLLFIRTVNIAPGKVIRATRTLLGKN